MLVTFALVACGARSGGDAASASDATGGDRPDQLVLPPIDGDLDYQLGGAYPPPAGVQIVARDRTAQPAAGLYNVCYVNGFQVQPDEAEVWLTDHADLILRDGQGNPVIDPDWDEMLVDVSTPARRARVAAIVGGWIDGCRAAGFAAVEIDNLDSFTRSGGRLTEEHAVAAMRLFADAAHASGLPIGQKNAAELVGRRAELGTDFAVSEECARWDECEAYLGAYGDHVLAIEYRRQDFTTACARWGARLSIVLRDVELVPAGQPGHVFDGC